ncbi:DUF4265 domain-containing protein [Candidatus Ornithobacterium hominis]|uniref:DUF4265 domain-containing protein n=1 Tax=Candidatus Ornithobacterium hominis TaxID=2497989 RepID=UPI0024BCA8C1|nr:DUF4265 domain-containing protein [Candidatus Ornithobacterium hominis]CAI9430347.1 DUF4265 domain-containing protein [Candidatus Ornithobacterium hominis]
MIKSKIKFVYYDLKGELATESLWADKYGNYYQVKNIPFFFPNIAYNDVIKVEEDSGELFFDELIIPSGNSTIQIVIYKITHKKNILKELKQLGCGWEGLRDQPYYSINIPKEVNLDIVISYLEEECKKNILDYKVACIG